ncbi:MAG: hypothetical protein IAE91_08065 [Ignavibacteriaceae bacterium]|nr:hypothetical protein [Ignavibacteriaceae bacterium]
MKRILLLSLLFSLFSLNYAQDKSGNYLTVGFYNVENLFDTLDDPRINDEEFLPASEKEWNAEKYSQKLKNLGRVINLMGKSGAPEILGLCEVENLGVITDLVQELKSENEYKIAHYDSPDGRGIDAALVYAGNLFTLENLLQHEVFLPDLYPTRTILHAVLKYKNGELYHFFVNHWPSRRGGQDESVVNRISAATSLRVVVDALFEEDPNSNIIIMGDFNDEPADTSISYILQANNYLCDSTGNVVNNALYNLSYKLKESGYGTYKYRENWNMLDQIMVSGSLARGEGRGYICGTFTIFKPDFILQTEGNYKGTSLPTFGGKRYFGGYSDHFSIFALFNFD